MQRAISPVNESHHLLFSTKLSESAKAQRYENFLEKNHDRIKHLLNEHAYQTSAAPYKLLAESKIEKLKILIMFVDSDVELGKRETKFIVQDSEGYAFLYNINQSKFSYINTPFWKNHKALFATYFSICALLYAAGGTTLLADPLFATDEQTWVMREIFGYATTGIATLGLAAISLSLGYNACRENSDTVLKPKNLYASIESKNPTHHNLTVLEEMTIQENNLGNSCYRFC